MRRIGIDVGGTNTDAVLLEDGEIMASAKTPTTEDMTAGVADALARVIGESGVEPASIDAVMIGTTHFTNAILQGKALTPVAAVRICLPTSRSLEPGIDWPPGLRETVCGRCFLLEGGHEYDGRPIVPFDEAGMREAARQIGDTGLRSVAVTSVFSPLNNACEERAAEILDEICPRVDVTLSHELGRIGLLERENVALLNASLRELARKTTRAFSQAIADSGLDAALYLTRNDGTVVFAEVAEAYPISSIASGPTNSMRGAAYLSQMKDAIVVDAGGTTTDVGMLKNGFPRQANNVIEIGGVRTLFRMPDLFSLAIGGGTLIKDAPLEIGPESTGYALTSRGLAFGGAELTATDLAIARGLVAIGDPGRVASLPDELVNEALGAISTMIEDAVDRIKVAAGDLPLIAVGGAAFLVPERSAGVSEVVRVERGEVANAIGAAMAQISGEVDQVFRNVRREQAIEDARRIAEDRAIVAGADPATLEPVEIEDLPLAYMPGNALRVRVRVVGDLLPG